MLDALLTPIYTNDFTLVSYLLCTLASLVLGVIIAFAAGFKKTNTKSFTLALVLLPAIVQTVIMLVNGNLGTGVAVMGAFSLVRFRSAPGSAKDIVSIFLAMASGLATAMGQIAMAFIFVVIVCAVMIISNYIKFSGMGDLTKELRITIPEDLNYSHCFDDIFEKYTKSVNLTSVKTTNMGSLYKLFYSVELKNEDSMQEFIDELRCRNGNLEIAMSLPGTVHNEL